MDAIIISIIGAIVSLSSVLTLFLKSRKENAVATLNAKTNLDTLIDARVTKQLQISWEKIDELSEKVDTLETRENQRTNAITRIFRAIAKQWPGPDGPDLDPADIAILEDTIPSAWIRKRPK